MFRLSLAAYNIKAPSNPQVITQVASCGYQIQSLSLRTLYTGHIPVSTPLDWMSQCFRSNIAIHYIAGKGSYTCNNNGIVTNAAT